MALEFTISPSIKGYVYETDFVFRRTNLPSYNIAVWDLGDGTTIYNPTSSAIAHTYEFPGVYKVGLSAWSQAGDFEFQEQYVDVDYKIRDAIKFTNIPQKWSIIGQRTSTPFVVSLTSVKIDEPIAIVLHSAGSKSVPYTTLIDKWRFLVPTWQFVDAATDKVISGPVLLETTPISSNGKVIAVTASYSFYYIDNHATITNTSSDPIILTATLSTQNFVYPPESLIYPYYSYSNTESVKAAAFCHVYDVVPNQLKVTENFLSDIYPIKWTNIPIPILITFYFNPLALSGINFGSEVSATNVFAYPKSNEQGKLSELTLALSGLTPTSYTPELSPLYFRKLEENNTLASGYLFTSLSCSVPISSTKVIANTKVYAQPHLNPQEFAFPEGYPLNYYAYISHPYENNINVVEYNTFSSDLNYAEYYKSKGMLLEGKISTMDVPKNVFNSTNNLTVSGLGGVYAVAYNPILKNLYAADSDSNKIFLYREDQLHHTLDLSSAVHSIFGVIPSLSARINELPISPSSLSIDGQNNIWVALHDASLILKYNSTLTALLSYATPYTNLIKLFDDIEEISGSPFVTPATVKTDRLNNVWSCYSDEISGTIAKYNSFGQLQFLSAYPMDTTPVDIAITKENNVWVACRDANRLFCYNTTGQVLSSLEVLKPSYITIDKQNNLWVAHGYNFLSKYNTKTLEASSWKMSNSPVFNYELKYTSQTPVEEYSAKELEEAYDFNEIWGGLTTDVLNRVWAINSELNSVLVLPANSPDKIKNISLIPKSHTNYYITSAGLLANEVFAENVRSAQSVGDFTGNEWYQKYGEDYQSAVITGTSVPFSILDINGAPSLAKINEDFSYAQYFKNLTFPELLQQNETLFEDFINPMVGNGSLSAEEIGRIMYEKIANFVLNHSDVETSEIPQLLSLVDQVKQSAKRYGANYPAEVQRLLNLFSVTLHRLRGIPRLDPDVNNNVGPLLNGSDLVTAGDYLYVYDIKYSTYQIFQVSELSGASTYPLSSIQLEGIKNDVGFESVYNEVPTEFVQTLKDSGVQIYQGEKIGKELGKFYRKLTGLSSKYRFFEFNPEVSIGYQGNLIDWNNIYTTVSYNVSSSEEYYKENGIVELYFNNLLTKRLFGK